MTTRFKLVLILLIVIVLWKAFQYSDVLTDSNTIEASLNPLSENGKIKITVYYEALCSDSRGFILKQLVPTYDNLAKYIELVFVPYGKAKTIEENGQITFQCQHKALECLANKIHACGLAKISDPDLQLKYVACMIDDNMIPEEVGERCAKELNINYNPIQECASGTLGSLLLKGHGIQTDAVNPSITFIPTIELDGSQKVPLAHILKNLQKELCNIINPRPIECS